MTRELNREVPLQRQNLPQHHRPRPSQTIQLLNEIILTILPTIAQPRNITNYFITELTTAAMRQKQKHDTDNKKNMGYNKNNPVFKRDSLNNSSLLSCEENREGKICTVMEERSGKDKEGGENRK